MGNRLEELLGAWFGSKEISSAEIYPAEGRKDAPSELSRCLRSKQPGKFFSIAIVVHEQPTKTLGKLGRSLESPAIPR